jgi:hypothetical protein
MDLSDFHQMAAAQEQMQQLQQMQLGQALEHPHTLTEIRMCSLAISPIPDENGIRVLRLGLLTGDRIDVMLAPAALNLLRRALEEDGE